MTFPTSPDVARPAGPTVLVTLALLIVAIIAVGVALHAGEGSLPRLIGWLTGAVANVTAGAVLIAWAIRRRFAR